MSELKGRKLEINRRDLLAFTSTLALQMGLGLRAASSAEAAPGLKQTFDSARASYLLLRDYTFGHGNAAQGAVQIANTSDLEDDWQFWANNLGSPSATINTETQRYMPFTSDENFVFTAEALELTGILANGAPEGVRQVAIVSSVAKSRELTVEDANGLRAGQVVSLGDRQADNLHLTCMIGLGIEQEASTGEMPNAGGRATLAIEFAEDLETKPVAFEYSVSGTESLSFVGQWFVDQVNGSEILRDLGITAFKDPDNPGSYCVAIPKYQAGNAPEFGRTAKGSLRWAWPQASGTGGLVHGHTQAITSTYVVAKTGNRLRLNHPVSAKEGETLHIMPSCHLMRSRTYEGGGSSVIPLSDTTGIEVGQAVQLSYQDSNLRYVVSKTDTTITLNADVYLPDGIIITSYAMMIWPLANDPVNKETLSFSEVPVGVRVGQQVLKYLENPNSNLIVTAIDRASHPQTVTLNGPLPASAGELIVFHEPIHSGQIWSKWGLAPGVDGVNLAAMELDCEVPNASVVAWPAFWLFSDYAQPTLLPVPEESFSEIDMMEVFNYWNNTSVNSFRPGSVGKSVDIYRHPAYNGEYLEANNTGDVSRKIQVIWSDSKVYFYMDNILILAQTFRYDQSHLAQIGINLAMGSTSAAFNSNGFFPLDFSQFPVKFKIKRLRIWVN